MYLDSVMRRKLTKQFITAASSAEREVIHWDTEVPGLGFRITASGSKSFILKTRIGGGRSAPIKKPTLGKVGDLTLDQARATGRDWKVLAASGVDPTRHKEESGRTVADLCAEYLEVHALPKKRSGEGDRSKIERHVLPRLGRKLVKDVSFSDVERLHRAMKKSPYAANRTAALLSKMFSLAVKWEWVDRNPARGIERYPEEKRERFLGADEIQRLSQALVDYVATSPRPDQAQKTADAIRLLMLTGARRSEVLSATWDMFDIEAGIWIKPSSHTKQKKKHRVPLSPPALQLLQKIQDQERDPRFVFPSRPGSKHPHLTELKKAWAKICGLAGLDGVRIHDLRHTYASILVSGGASLPLIGALLGHTQVQTTQRYAHLMDDPLREATARVGAIVEGAERGEVVPLRRKQDER
jgi:integrase